MTDIYLSMLSKAPDILEQLISEIPKERLKQKRITGKWCIHEHACHLYDSQKMMIDRFKIFKNTRNPSFQPYLPGTASTPDDHLLKMDIEKCLSGFRENRFSMISFLKNFTTEDWKNEASHPQYIKYNPDIFLRHIVMHDHFHMYRIEELWLTTDAYL